VLADHAPELRLDVVLVDDGAVVDEDQLRATVRGLGGELVVADVAADDGTPRHDATKLAGAYARIIGAT
jgi:hypothetical protein